MKSKAIFITILLSVVFVSSSYGQLNDFPVLKGPYLGQKPPGMTPEIFAPGIVSTEDSQEFAGTFSPCGNEFFFTRAIEPPNMQIMYTVIKDGKWTEPSLSPIAYECSEAQPHISPDGNKLFYASRRPLPGSTELTSSSNIWISNKSGNSWTEPYLLENPFKDNNFLMYVTSSNNGTIYFRSQRGVFFSRFIDGKYTEPEFLPEEINAPTKGNHPYIAPDESYIIFDTMSNPPIGFGSSDLFISFRKSDGSWTKAANMGEIINSEGYEVAPSVSSDGKFFFFESDKAGSMDIYWVDAKIIEQLKSDEFQK
jgi:Tol biopolymer transport system component